MVKFSHTIFAMPFAIIGYFLATKQTGFNYQWDIFIYIILCMIFARNAAMGFNRFIDRNIDKKNPRTAIREIPAGKISKNSALWFVIINSIAFIVTTYFINKTTLFLSPVALLVVLGYSYTKRFTALCHFVLGVGLSLAPIGAYISITNKFELLPILFSFIVLFWVSGFDIIYALQDEVFDKSENLKSIPGFMGKKGALILSTILHFIVIIILAYISYFFNFGLLFKIGSGLFALLLIYQHLIVKPNDLSKVNLAFFTTNGISSILLCIFTLLDIFLN